MLGDIVIYIIIILIALIPVVLWGYLFSYLDERPNNNSRFFVGIFAGILAVPPILYLEQISQLVQLPILNTFLYLRDISSFTQVFSVGWSLLLLLLFIVCFSLLGIAIFRNSKSLLSTYISNIAISSIFVLFLVVLFLGIHYLFILFPSLHHVSTDTSGSVSLLSSSLKFVLFYYLIVGFIEEISKHFNFLPASMNHIDHYKTGVLYAIFVALGFSFIENILYFYNEYSHNGIGNDFLQLYFFRSIFTIIVHVLCSSIIAYYFAQAYLTYKKKSKSSSYLKTFFIGLLWWILLHSVFDIALTLWLSFVIILYFIWGYFYVSYLLYRD